jgi:hypothetical protein
MRSLGRLISAALATASMMLVATPTSAAVMFANFSGSVIAGTPGNATFDTTNFFGLGTNPVGALFRATFKYDTDLGHAITNTSTDSRYGGPFWDGGMFTSPILEASITINGITDIFNTTRNGSANVTINDAGWHQTFFYTDYFVYPVENALQLYVLNTPDPLSLTTPYTGGNLLGLGGPTTQPFAYSFIEGGKNYRLALGPVETTLYSLAVPEPATWGLMIIGFACTGAMLRSRRRVLARA